MSIDFFNDHFIFIIIQLCRSILPALPCALASISIKRTMWWRLIVSAVETRRLESLKFAAHSSPD